MDGYLSKLRGLASSAANAVQSKIGRDYDADFSTHGTGTSGLWTLYATTRRGTSQPATIWVFDKQRFFDRGINRQTLGAAEQQRILSVLKAEAAQLTRLRHPAVLQVVEPLEETRGSLMFVTEQVAASLDDVAQRGGTVHVLGEAYELDELEMQKGLLQVARGLEFLHEGAGVVHGNLRPASVLVDGRGDWKLGGLGFSRAIGSPAAADGFEYDYALPEHAQPALAFMAPELVAGRSPAAAASDVFSLACLAAALHSHGASPLDCGHEVAAYRRALQGVRAAGGAAGGMPEALAGLVHAVLAAPAGQRLALRQVQASAYFDNALVAALGFLDGLAAQAAEQKVAFMRVLQQMVGRFPERVLRRTLLPALLEQTSDHALLPHTLANVVLVAGRLSADEFGPAAAPALRAVVQLADLPAPAALVLLAHLRLLQQRLPAAAFQAHMLPFLYACVASGDLAVQAQALAAACAVLGHVAQGEVREHLLPLVQQVYGRATVLATKVQALECIRGMLAVLDRPSVVDRVLPMLRRTRSREPAVVMALAAAYDEAARRALDARGVAREVLPELWAVLVDARLDAAQFAVLEALIGRLSEGVLAERRAKAAELGRLEGGGQGAAAVGPAAGTADAQQAVGLEALLRAATITTAGSPNGAGAPAGAPAGGWEWDAPAAEAVEADGGLGSFGSLGSPELVPELVPRPAASSAKVAQRLRTASAQSGGGRLGAMRLGPAAAAAAAAGTTASFGFSLPPPPASKKPHAAEQTPLPARPPALSFGQTLQPTATAKPSLAAAPARQQQTQQTQAHRGGKTSDLGDFDPFAYSECSRAATIDTPLSEQPHEDEDEDDEAEKADAADGEEGAEKRDHQEAWAAVVRGESVGESSACAGSSGKSPATSSCMRAASVSGLVAGLGRRTRNSRRNVAMTEAPP
ncbi:Protein kinase domain-containing protein ppk32 [Coemansia erecta]|uniref:Protein kinase domain-containing protein ppk32 n=1 Tax=Coemansia erecta TaxID=147472 RepID=A0A9W8CPV5_9FUNG|nr:Protein kinase domain-containing protein ppk32 [Coemansia erecta]